MTSPINPLDLNFKTEPAASPSKRRSPIPEAIIDESAPIQPLKKSAIDITLKTQALKLLFAQIIDDGEILEYVVTADFILVSTALNKYKLFANRIQRQILFEAIDDLRDTEILSHFCRPISCRAITSLNNEVEFNLSLFSLFFTRNPIADRLRDIFFCQSSISFRKMRFADAGTFATVPYFSPAARFINPAYVKQSASLFDYMLRIDRKKNSKLYIFRSSGIDPTKIESKIGIKVPSIEVVDSISYQNQKFFAELEAEEAEKIICGSSTGSISTPYLRKIAQFKETCSPLLLLDTLYFKVGSFDFELTGDMRFFENPVMSNLLNAGINPPNHYDESKSFKDNLVHLLTVIHPSLSLLANTMEHLDDKTCSLKIGAGTLKISHASTVADAELEEFLKDALAGISTDAIPRAEEIQEIVPQLTNIPLDTIIAKLLSALSWQICFTETASIVFNPSTHTYTATSVNGQNYIYSLKPCHIQALTGEMSKEDYLDAFIEPIVCNVKGYEFNFSLFSMIYSRDLVKEIKIDKIDERFLIYASSYICTPLTHPYLNPDYKRIITTPSINIAFLCAQKGLKFRVPISKDLYEKIDSFKDNPAKFALYEGTFNFKCDFFFVQEANLAVSNTHEKTKLTPYLEAWKRTREKHPGMRISSEKIIYQNENGSWINVPKTAPIHVATIPGFISKNVKAPLVKQTLRILLRPFITNKDFNFSYFYYPNGDVKHKYIVSTSDDVTYELYLDDHQQSILTEVKTYNLLELEAFSRFIAVKIKTHQGESYFKTCLLSLLYYQNPFTSGIVSNLKSLNTPSIAAAFINFLANATEFAIQPFDSTLYLNPDYIPLFETISRNLCHIVGSDNYTFPCSKTRLTALTTKTLKLIPYTDVATFSLYCTEIETIKKGITPFKDTPHINRWLNFTNHVRIITFNQKSMTFDYKGEIYEIENKPIALHEVFKLINGDNLAATPAPQYEPVKTAMPLPVAQTANVAPIANNPQVQPQIKEALKALLFPLVSETFEYTLNAIGQQMTFGVFTSENTYTLDLNVDQSMFLNGIAPYGFEDISRDLIAPIEVLKGDKSIGKTSIFALFYNDNELTTKLKAQIKSSPYKLLFLAHGITFALHPIIFTGPTCNPKLIPLLTNFYRHFVEINDGSNVFPGSQHKTRIVVGDTEWNFSDTTITTQSRYYLASSEANACTTMGNFSIHPLQTEHIALWQRFFKAVKYISHNTDSIRFLNGTERVKLQGLFLSTHTEFKKILGIPLNEEEAPVPAPEPLPIAPPIAEPPPAMPIASSELPMAPQASIAPPSAPNTPAMQKQRIANVIETFWFQNPVNYSRWIKLLQKSRAVFAFNSLPQELMEPLKSFKKEHVEEVLKYFGVGVDLTGNLEDELIDKVVPTLLRVKAAEFKLLKKTISEEKELKEIEFKPCYLVKPGPRFVHVIKVIARFDEHGLLSGFLMAEGKAESNISLDAFNRLVEEGKNKRAIVLQRETVKLTEEAQKTVKEPSLERKKREREEVEKKEEEENAAKVAREDPILPPVPVARPNHKRPSGDNTVKPKAPKESKFNDKSDITTDKKRALGKHQEGGIIPPPEMIEQPKAPDLQQALSLDELFSALSANAGAHINHVVKISLNQLKAIFSEEPLSYEGLELITKLESTPVPSTPCLVPKAKSYQWDFVMEAKRRENAGLGTILAPYMGLGKTWIYNSKILLSLYEDSKGHHLIITPKPLRKTITEDAIVILNDARLNAFVHLKSLKWGNWCADSIIKESSPREISFLLSLLGLFDEETFNKIMMGRGPITNRLVTTYVKGFQQYPTQLKRLYEYCKSIAPKTLPERGRFDEKGLERILKFSSSRIIKSENGKDLLKNAKDDESKIIIASYEHAEHLASDPVCTPGCASITFDEAQYIHNPEINIAKAADTLLKALKPKAKMAVTGTPIENGIEDLFQLVGLMAPELKCPSILSTLHSLSSGASRFTKFKDREQALTHLIKFHGHLQAYLTRVSQNLVLILKKDDPRVKEAWGDGAKVEYTRENISISALAEEKYKQAHELFKTRKVDPATGKKLDSNMAYYSRVASIMLDPELKAENLTKKDPAVQRLLKWIKSEPDNAKIDELIARSAILSSIVYSPKTRKAVDEKRVELIFVANIAVGKVIRKVLKRKFPETQGSESYLMYGDQKDEKKDKIIDSLKETGKSKFGILSIESGSTGFSIPDAYVTIMQTLSYNVATELQAIGRMDRATSKGEKHVIYPRFGIFSEEHIPVVQEIKKLTFKSFFSPAATQIERLKDIALLNRHNIYQSFLNEKRDAREALIEMEEIDAITESIISGVDEEELQAFIMKLTPPLPIIAPPPARIAAVAKITLAPPLRIAGNKLFKMPLPNALSNEDKVRLAQFIQENKKALEGPLKEIYSQFKNAELRQLVRTGAPMPSPESARAHQILMNLIQDAKQTVRSIDDIGIDRFKIDGQDYVLENKSHPERTKRVKIVSSINGPFEILIG